MIVFLLLPSYGVSQKESAGPVLHPQHFSLLCADKEEVVPIYPLMEYQAPIEHLEFQDSYFHLDCRTEGLKGYFDPANWQVEQEIIRKGDGGVDVTGAPDARLVEGADGALAFAAPGGTLHLQQTIPAEGYLALDLVKVGSSISFSPTIIITVNGKQLKKITPLKDKYNFFSTLLEPGDNLQFSIQNNDEVTGTINLRNFRFYTNAAGVIQRQWTVRDRKGYSDSATQFIVINTPNLSDIRFPEYLPEVSVDPDFPHTQGLPYIDRDGDLETVHDQFSLLDASCSFQLDYWDEPILRDGENLLLRHWTISDLCGDNVLEEDQLFKIIPATLPSDIEPMEPLRNLDTPRPSILPNSVGAAGMLH